MYQLKHDICTYVTVTIAVVFTNAVNKINDLMLYIFATFTLCQGGNPNKALFWLDRVHVLSRWSLPIFCSASGGPRGFIYMCLLACFCFVSRCRLSTLKTTFLHSCFWILHPCIYLYMLLGSEDDLHVCTSYTMLWQARLCLQMANHVLTSL